MPPDNLPENNNEQPIQPLESSTPYRPPETASLPTDSNPVATAPEELPKKKRSKFAIVILVLVLVIASTSTAVFYARHKKLQTTSTKKDIPYLTYGSDVSADLTRAYPTEVVDTDTTTQVNTQLFEGLVRYQQITKIVPLLAASWSNPDDSTWLFNLQHGIKFHDGRTMTADDVKYSLDYAVAHQNDNNGATLRSLASTIKQVEVVNPYQVKVITDGPDPILLNRLAYLYILDSKAKVGDYNAGTGSYTVKPGSTPTSNVLDLVAYNGYWGGHIYTKQVHIQVSSNEQLTTDTNNGKFDIANDFTNEQLAKIKLPYKPLISHDLGITFIGLNTLKAGSPLQSLAARQAASYALDIPAILKAGSINGIPSNQLIPSSIPGHDPSIKSILYNPAKAKQLLTGVPNVSTPLTLSYPTGDEGQVAEIAKELNAVGFNVKTASVADLDSLVSMGFGGKTDMFYVADSTSTLDGLALFNDIVLGAIPADYSNSLVPKLVEQAGTTINPTARIAILQKISQQVAKDIPDIPLYTQTRTGTLTKPYHVEVDIPSIEAGIYFWQTYQ